MKQKACVSGHSCIGQSCSYDSDCSFNQTCCRSKCVGGTTCLGRSCSYNSDCSIDEVCCNKKCKAGSDCIGESCSSYSNCQTGENCCKEKCVKTIGGCPIPENRDWGLIIGLSAGGVVFVCISVASPKLRRIYKRILGARRRRRHFRRLLSANVTQNVTTTITTAEDGTAIVTEQITTSVSANPATQCNTLYQPEGPPSDQQRDQPPPYTEPPSGEADGTYAPQNDSFTPTTAGIV